MVLLMATDLATILTRMWPLVALPAFGTIVPVRRALLEIVDLVKFKGLVVAGAIFIFRH